MLLNFNACRWRAALVLLLFLALFTPSVVKAQHSFTAVLSSGDEIVLNWQNPQILDGDRPRFRSSDIVSIAVNGATVDLSRLLNIHLDLDFNGSSYNLINSPPPAGQDIASSIIVLDIYDGPDNYLHLLSFFNMINDVSDCSNSLCRSPITSSDNVTISAFYYGLLDILLWSIRHCGPRDYGTIWRCRCCDVCHHGEREPDGCFTVHGE